MVEIDPRRQEPETAGQVLARALEFPDQSERQIRARAVAADRNLFGRVAVAAQAPPDGQRVVARGRKRMLGGQAVGGGQGAQAPCPSGLGHQSAVADNRTRAIASAMKVDQHAGGVGARDDRPFALDAVEIDRLELDVVRDRPGRPDLLDPATAFFPADRPRLGAEESANGVDFGLRHPLPPTCPAHSTRAANTINRCASATSRSMDVAARPVAFRQEGTAHGRGGTFLSVGGCCVGAK